MVPTPRVRIAEVKEEDLPFLFELWQDSQVMRFADEFPRIRHWSRKSSAEKAWKRYLAFRAEHGTRYTQFILWLADDTRIGESFVGPVPEHFKGGSWQKPPNVRCVIADIKLLPRYWGQGLGTEGMCQVVQFVFTQTTAELFIVPPAKKNMAAQRVYEKVGFVHTGKTWMGHWVMEMSKTQFEKVYGH